MNIERAFLKKNKICLDYSTTPISSKTLEEMLPFFQERWGSIASSHSMGSDLIPYVDMALKEIYHHFGAEDSDSFFLTSCAAEAVSQVIMGCYFGITRKTGKNHFLTTNHEEAFILRALQHLSEMKCHSTMMAVNVHGQLTLEALEEAITARTALVSLSWANGLTGVIQPVADLAEVCRKRGVLFHLDASDVIGKLFFRFDELKCDFLTFDGDRFHAPKGTGGLFMRDIKIPPLIFGGNEQAYQRGGTLNTPFLAALKVACHEADSFRDHMGIEIARLRDKFEIKIREEIPEAKVFFKDVERLPHISAIAFPYVASDALLYALQNDGVYAQAGGGRTQQLTRLLTATGVEPSLAACAVSFSFSRATTEEEIDQAIPIIIKHAKRLKAISP